MNTVQVRWADECHCDTFEKLLNEGKITYDQPVVVDELDQYTHLFLTVYGMDSIECIMGDVIIQKHRHPKALRWCPVLTCSST